jgi:hypothetical protein
LADLPSVKLVASLCVLILVFDLGLDFLFISLSLAVLDSLFIKVEGVWVPILLVGLVKVAAAA